MMDQTEKKPNRNLIFARVECLKHYKGGITNPKQFVLDLSDLPYFNKKELKKIGKSVRIYAEFVFTNERAAEIYSESNWAALWYGKLYIKEALPKSYEMITEEKLKGIIESIRIRVRHETQHMIQMWMSIYKQLKNDTLVSKKMRDDGTQENTSMQQERNVAYSLSDMEFYPLLTDSIKMFKLAVNKFPANLHGLLFDVWIGRANYSDLEKAFVDQFNKQKGIQSDDSPDGKLRYLMPQEVRTIETGSQLFIDLRDYSPQKYRKAVIEMYKAVQPLL